MHPENNHRTFYVNAGRLLYQLCRFRNEMWEIPKKYGIPGIYTNMTRVLYRNYIRATLEHKGKLIGNIKINTGVRQDCILSSTVFLIITDWIMRNTVDNKTTITYHQIYQLKDLELSDVVCLTHYKEKKQMKKKTEHKYRNT